MLKWLSVLAVALLVSLSPAHAQMSDQQRAQAYYFEAEAALADGRLKDANELRIKAWKILGGGNPKLEFLAARIYYSAGAYDDAQAAVERFYSHDPGPNLRREIAPYVVKIEAKLEEARLAEIAAAEAREEARLAKIEEERERAAKVRRNSLLRANGSAVEVVWTTASPTLVTARVADVIAWTDGRSLALAQEWEKPTSTSCILRIFSPSGKVLRRREIGGDEHCGGALARPDGSALIATASDFVGLFKGGYEISFWEYSADGNLDRIARTNVGENIWHNIVDLQVVGSSVFFVGYKDKFFPSQSTAENVATFGTLTGKEISLQSLGQAGTHFDSVAIVPETNVAFMVGQDTSKTVNGALFASANASSARGLRSFSKSFDGKPTHLSKAISLGDGKVAVFYSTGEIATGSDSGVMLFDPAINDLVEREQSTVDSFYLTDAVAHPDGGFIAVGFSYEDKQSVPMVIGYSEDFGLLWVRDLEELNGQMAMRVTVVPGGDVLIQTVDLQYKKTTVTRLRLPRAE